jgi:hypothetical protein
MVYVMAGICINPGFASFRNIQAYPRKSPLAATPHTVDRRAQPGMTINKSMINHFEHSSTNKIAIDKNMISKYRIFYTLIVLVILSGCKINTSFIHDKLLDGWYLPSKTVTKNVRNLSKWQEKHYYLENNPLISFADIDSVFVELLTEPDSSIMITYYLTSEAQRRYIKTISKMEREELIFVLNDTLINFRMIYSEVQRKEPLSLMLGYSDYNQEEINKIVKDIKDKIKK